MISNTRNLVKPKTGKIVTPLAATVKGRETIQQSWKHSAELISVSRTGAGFYLNRRCQVGQLVSMLLPMPARYRCYDRDKELYRIWGLVQHCHLMAEMTMETYHIGVAFIGKQAPASYYDNPSQSYRISGMTTEGLWHVVEAHRSFIHRREFRHWVTLDVAVSGADTEGEPLTDEKAATENISQKGATVITSLRADIGDSIKFTCAAHNFSTPAVVRNTQVNAEEKIKLHLEFIDHSFPVRELLAAR